MEKIFFGYDDDAQALLTISRDDIERARLLSEFKGEMDAQSKLVDARRAGLAEGRTEGRAEGRAEGRTEGRAEGMATIIRSMMKTMSIADVAMITGIDKVEIEALTKEI